MLTVKVGRPLRKLIRAAYLANQPVLIIGRHGIGKSQIFEAVAKELGIGCEVFDLSIMESVDLAGLPIVIAGAMTYAPPKRLPSSGKGVIVFEELNRVAPDLQATCLQLCTARRFNDYILPSGYVPVAAINPPDEDYDTKEIDPALISRFLKVHAIADPVEWISWARDSKVHTACIEYIRQNPKAILSPNLSPRTLDYISRFIQHSGADEETLLNGIIGLSDEENGAKIFKLINNVRFEPLTVKVILKSPEQAAAIITKMALGNRTDLLDLTVQQLLCRVDEFSPKQIKSIAPVIDALPESYRNEFKEFIAA